jgi:hypothetical protein
MAELSITELFQLEESRIYDNYGGKNKCLDILVSKLWLIMNVVMEIDEPFIHPAVLDVRTFAHQFYAQVMDGEFGELIPHDESITEEHLRVYWNCFLELYSIRFSTIRISSLTGKVLSRKDDVLGQGSNLEHMYIVLRLYDEFSDGHYVLVSEVDHPLCDYVGWNYGGLVDYVENLRIPM